GWRRHPAAAMWAGYEEALVRYGLVISEAWVRLGHADTTAATLLADLHATTGIDEVRDQGNLAESGDLPPWLGDADFHLSHQPLFGDVPDDLPYVWPGSDRERRVPLDARA
ncbi:MAG: cytoplasmic protein, partial [Mycobacterium sp.]|nr:cytoplasmic protein [Mycobacterium sp.]